jgi:hypothetical protein
VSAEHDRLRHALAPVRSVEPRDDEVAAVLARAAREREHRPARRALAVVLAVLIALGGTLAVPAGREAAGAAFDRLVDFLEGGDAPGERLPSGEPEDVLNWLGDATPGSPRVLARSGGQRLVAYRQRGTGHACFSLGRQVTECGDAAYWAGRFSGGVVLPLITTPTDQPDVVALWGISTDAVAALEVRLPDGRRLMPEVGDNGFVLLAPEGPAPEVLVARDREGRVLAEAPLDELQWRFETTP